MLLTHISLNTKTVFLIVNDSFILTERPGHFGIIVTVARLDRCVLARGYQDR